MKNSNKSNQDVSYYAIIPANVRYDKNLKANAKLLYGEITALCNEKGYCWAGNDYFADLYEVSKRTIQNWISNLEKNDYIKIRYKDIVKDGKNTTQRRIYLPEVANIDWGRNKNQGMKNSSPHKNQGVKKISPLKGMKNSSPQMGEKNFTPSKDKNPSSNSNPEGKKSSNNTYNITRTEEEESKSFSQRNKKQIPDNVNYKFTQIFNRKMSKEFYKKVVEIYSDIKIIMKALEVAETNADKPVYLLKILQDWQNNNLKSIEGINTYLEDRQAHKTLRQSKKETTATKTETPEEELQRLYKEGYR
ncbi:MAG: helix-turn-helix domain-containing protein [bacterium]